MDSHNLAVCFGPTLIQQQESDDDILMWQTHINDLVQTMIVFQEDIFPQEPGTLYEDPSFTGLRWDFEFTVIMCCVAPVCPMPLLLPHQGSCKLGACV